MALTSLVVSGLLLLTLLPSLVPAQTVTRKENYLIVTTVSNNVCVLSMRGVVQHEVNETYSYGVDFDPITARIFWTNYHQNTIETAFLNGSQRNFRQLPPGADPKKLAVDHKRKLVFYSDFSNDRIGVMGTDGGSNRTVRDQGLTQPYALAVDVIHKVLYYTEKGLNTAKIGRMNYNGSGHEVLVNISDYATGLALDVRGGRMYWATYSGGTIESARLDGTNRTVVLRDQPNPTALAFFDGVLYFSSIGSSLIYTVTVNGTDQQALKTNLRSHINGIAVYSESLTDIDECAVNNGGCPHTCTNNNGSFACSCRPGYTENGQTCTDMDECTTGSHNCSSTETCTNTAGGFNCTCKAGYERNAASVCLDKNECEVNYRGCQHECRNISGSFFCACRDGFQVDPNNRSACRDIDECESSPCENQATCENVPGTFRCSCIPGYTGRLCETVSESLADGHTKGLVLGLGIGLGLVGLLSLICLFLFLRQRGASSRRASPPQANEMTLMEGVRAGDPSPAAAIVAMETAGSPTQQSQEATENDYEKINDYDPLDGASRVGVTEQQYESVHSAATSDGDRTSYLELVDLPLSRSASAETPSTSTSDGDRTSYLEPVLLPLSRSASAETPSTSSLHPPTRRVL